MFQSEYTEALYDRKANAIIKFCEDRPQGFFYEEIEGLTQLFDFARADLFEKEVLEMVPALKTMLMVISQDSNNMFNKNAGSDELRYLRLVPTFLDSLEYKMYNLGPSSGMRSIPSPSLSLKISGILL